MSSSSPPSSTLPPPSSLCSSTSKKKMLTTTTICWRMILILCIWMISLPSFSSWKESNSFFVMAQASTQKRSGLKGSLAAVSGGEAKLSSSRSPTSVLQPGDFSVNAIGGSNEISGGVTPIRLKAYNPLSPGTVVNIPIGVPEFTIGLDGNAPPKLRSITSASEVQGSYSVGDEVIVSMNYYDNVIVKPTPTTISISVGKKAQEDTIANAINNEQTLPTDEELQEIDNMIRTPRVLLNTGCRDTSCVMKEVQSFVCRADSGAFSLRMGPDVVADIGVNTTVVELKRRLENELTRVERVTVEFEPLPSTHPEATAAFMNVEIPSGHESFYSNRVCSPFGTLVTLRFDLVNAVDLNGNLPPIELDSTNAQPDFRTYRPVGTTNNFLRQRIYSENPYLSTISTELIQGANRTNSYATYKSGNGTLSLLFGYIVQVGDVVNNLDVLVLDDTLGYIASLRTNEPVKTILPSPGQGARYMTSSASSLSHAEFVSISSAIPKITRVKASNPDGVYTAGDTIYIEVTFDLSVILRGEEDFTLTIYSSMLTTQLPFDNQPDDYTLVFRYAVGIADNTPLLTYTGPLALNLNGGKIYRVAGFIEVNAVTTLPIPGTSNSLSGTSNIEINTLAPVVLDFSVVNPIGTYTAGDQIILNVVYNTPVTVYGIPRILLNNIPRNLQAMIRTAPFDQTFTYRRAYPGGPAQIVLDFIINWRLDVGDEVSLYLPRIETRSEFSSIDSSDADRSAAYVVIESNVDLTGNWDATNRVLYLTVMNTVPAFTEVSVYLRALSGFFVDAGGVTAPFIETISIASHADTAVTIDLPISLVSPIGFERLGVFFTTAQYDIDLGLQVTFRVPEKLAVADSFSVNLGGLYNYFSDAAVQWLDVAECGVSITCESVADVNGVSLLFVWDANTATVMFEVISLPASTVYELDVVFPAVNTRIMPEYGSNGAVKVSAKMTENGFLNGRAPLEFTRACVAPKDLTSVTYESAAVGSTSAATFEFVSGWHGFKKGDIVQFELPHLPLGTVSAGPMWLSGSLANSFSVSRINGFVLFTAVEDVNPGVQIAIKVPSFIGITVPTIGVNSVSIFHYTVTSSICDLDASRHLSYNLQNSGVLNFVSGSVTATLTSNVLANPRTASAVDFTWTFAEPLEIDDQSEISISVMGLIDELILRDPTADPTVLTDWLSASHIVWTPTLPAGVDIRVTFLSVVQKFILKPAPGIASFTLPVTQSFRIVEVEDSGQVYGLRISTDGLANGFNRLAAITVNGRIEDATLGGTCMGICSASVEWSRTVTEDSTTLTIDFSTSADLPAGSELHFEALPLRERILSLQIDGVYQSASNVGLIGTGNSSPLRVVLNSPLLASVPHRIVVRGLTLDATEAAQSAASLPNRLSITNIVTSAVNAVFISTPLWYPPGRFIDSSFVISSETDDGFMITGKLSNVQSLAVDDVLRVRIADFIFTGTDITSLFDGISNYATFFQPFSTAKSSFNPTTSILSLVVEHPLSINEEFGVHLTKFSPPSSGLGGMSLPLYYWISFDGGHVLSSESSYYSFSETRDALRLSDGSITFNYGVNRILVSSITISFRSSSTLPNNFVLEVPLAEYFATVSGAVDVSMSSGSAIAEWDESRKTFVIRLLSTAVSTSPLMITISPSAIGFSVDSEGVTGNAETVLQVLDDLELLVTSLTVPLPCYGICSTNLYALSPRPAASSSLVLELTMAGISLDSNAVVSTELVGFTQSVPIDPVQVNPISCLADGGSFRSVTVSFVSETLNLVLTSGSLSTYYLKCEIPEAFLLVMPSTGIRVGTTSPLSINTGSGITLNQAMGLSLGGIGFPSDAELNISPRHPDAAIAITVSLAFEDDLPVDTEIRVYLPDFIIPTRPLAVDSGGLSLLVSGVSEAFSTSINPDGTTYTLRTDGYVSVILKEPIVTHQAVHFVVGRSAGIVSPSAGVSIRPLPWFAVHGQVAPIAALTFTEIDKFGAANPSSWELVSETGALRFTLSYTLHCTLQVGDAIEVTLFHFLPTPEVVDLVVTRLIGGVGAEFVGTWDGVNHILRVEVAYGTVSGDLSLDIALSGVVLAKEAVYSGDERLTYTLSSTTCPASGIPFSTSTAIYVSSSLITLQPILGAETTSSVTFSFVPTFNIAVGDQLTLKLIGLEFASHDDCVLETSGTDIMMNVTLNAVSAGLDDVLFLSCANGVDGPEVSLNIEFLQPVYAGEEVHFATMGDSDNSFKVVHDMATLRNGFSFTIASVNNGVLFNAVVQELKTVPYFAELTLSLSSTTAGDPTDLAFNWLLTAELLPSHRLVFHLPGLVLDPTAPHSWTYSNADATRQFGLVWNPTEETLRVTPQLRIAAQQYTLLEIPLLVGFSTTLAGFPPAAASPLLGEILSADANDALLSFTTIADPAVVPVLVSVSMAILDSSFESSYVSPFPHPNAVEGGGEWKVQLFPGHELTNDDVGLRIILDTVEYTIVSVADDSITLDRPYTGPAIVLGIPNIPIVSTSEVWAEYVSGSKSSLLTFSHLISRPEFTNPVSAYVTGGSLKSTIYLIDDAAVLRYSAAPIIVADLDLTPLSNNVGRIVNTDIPHVVSVQTTSRDGTYGAGDVIDVEVHFSEAVVLQQAEFAPPPHVELFFDPLPGYDFSEPSIGLAQYVSGSGTSILHFYYVIRETDLSDLTPSLLMPFIATAGPPVGTRESVSSVRIVVGNDKSKLRRSAEILHLDANTQFTALEINFASVVSINGRTPTISNIEHIVIDDKNFYSPGDTVYLRVVYSSPVDVTPVDDPTDSKKFSYPRIMLDTGSTAPGIARYIGFDTSVSNDGRVHLFAYTVRITDTLEGGLRLHCTCSGHVLHTHIELSSDPTSPDVATIVDIADPTLSASTVLRYGDDVDTLTIDANVEFDDIIPSINRISANASTAHLGPGDTLEISLTYTHSVTVSGFLRLRMMGGDKDGSKGICHAAYLSGSGTHTLKFLYHISGGSGTARLDCDRVSLLDTELGAVYRTADELTILSDNSLPILTAATSLALNSRLIIDTTPGEIRKLTVSNPGVSLLASQNLGLSLISDVELDELIELCGCEAWSLDGLDPAFPFGPDSLATARLVLTDLTLASHPQYYRYILSSTFPGAMSYLPAVISRCFNWWGGYELASDVELVATFNRPISQNIPITVDLASGDILNTAFSVPRSSRYDLHIDVDGASASLDRYFVLRYADRLSPCLSLGVQGSGEGSLRESLILLTGYGEGDINVRLSEGTGISRNRRYRIEFRVTLPEDLVVVTGHLVESLCIMSVHESEVRLHAPSDERVMLYPIRSGSSLILRANSDPMVAATLGSVVEWQADDGVLINEFGLEGSSLVVEEFDADERLIGRMILSHNSVPRVLTSTLSLSSSIPGDVDAWLGLEICFSEPIKLGQEVRVFLPTLEVNNLPTGVTGTEDWTSTWDDPTKLLTLTPTINEVECVMLPASLEWASLTLPDIVSYANSDLYRFSLWSNVGGTLTALRSDMHFEAVSPIGLDTADITFSDPRPGQSTSLTFTFTMPIPLISGSELRLVLPNFGAVNPTGTMTTNDVFLRLEGVLRDAVEVEWDSPSDTVILRVVERIRPGSYAVPLYITDDSADFIFATAGLSSNLPPTIEIIAPTVADVEAWSMLASPLSKYPKIAGVNRLEADFTLSGFGLDVNMLSISLELPSPIVGPLHLELILPSLDHIDGFSSWVSGNDVFKWTSNINGGGILTVDMIDSLPAGSVSLIWPLSGFFISYKGVPLSGNPGAFLGIVAVDVSMLRLPLQFSRRIPIIHHSQLRFPLLERDAFTTVATTTLTSVPGAIIRLDLNDALSTNDKVIVRLYGAEWASLTTGTTASFGCFDIIASPPPLPIASDAFVDWTFVFNGEQSTGCQDALSRGNPWAVPVKISEDLWRVSIEIRGIVFHSANVPVAMSALAGTSIAAGYEEATALLASVTGSSLSGNSGSIGQAYAAVEWSVGSGISARAAGSFDAFTSLSIIGLQTAVLDIATPYVGEVSAITFRAVFATSLQAGDAIVLTLPGFVTDGVWIDDRIEDSSGRTWKVTLSNGGETVDLQTSSVVAAGAVTWDFGAQHRFLLPGIASGSKSYTVFIRRGVSRSLKPSSLQVTPVGTLSASITLQRLGNSNHEFNVAFAGETLSKLLAGDELFIHFDGLEISLGVTVSIAENTDWVVRVKDANSLSLVCLTPQSSTTISFNLLLAQAKLLDSPFVATTSISSYANPVQNVVLITKLWAAVDAKLSITTLSLTDSQLITSGVTLPYTRLSLTFYLPIQPTSASSAYEDPLTPDPELILSLGSLAVGVDGQFATKYIDTLGGTASVWQTIEFLGTSLTDLSLRLVSLPTTNSGLHQIVFYVALGALPTGLSAPSLSTGVETLFSLQLDAQIGSLTTDILYLYGNDDVVIGAVAHTALRLSSYPISAADASLHTGFYSEILPMTPAYFVFTLSTSAGSALNIGDVVDVSLPGLLFSAGALAVDVLPLGAVTATLDPITESVRFDVISPVTELTVVSLSPLQVSALGFATPYSPPMVRHTTQNGVVYGCLPLLTVPSTLCASPVNSFIGLRPTTSVDFTFTTSPTPLVHLSINPSPDADLTVVVGDVWFIWLPRFYGARRPDSLLDLDGNLILSVTEDSGVGLGFNAIWDGCSEVVRLEITTVPSTLISAGMPDDIGTLSGQVSLVLTITGLELPYNGVTADVAAVLSVKHYIPLSSTVVEDRHTEHIWSQSFITSSVEQTAVWVESKASFSPAVIDSITTLHLDVMSTSPIFSGDHVKLTFPLESVGEVEFASGSCTLPAGVSVTATAPLVAEFELLSDLPPGTRFSATLPCITLRNRFPYSGTTAPANMHSGVYLSYSPLSIPAQTAGGGAPIEFPLAEVTIPVVGVLSAEVVYGSGDLDGHFDVRFHFELSVGLQVSDTISFAVPLAVPLDPLLPLVCSGDLAIDGFASLFDVSYSSGEVTLTAVRSIPSRRVSVFCSGKDNSWSRPTTLPVDIPAAHVYSLSAAAFSVTPITGIAHFSPRHQFTVLPVSSSEVSSCDSSLSCRLSLHLELSETWKPGHSFAITHTQIDGISSDVLAIPTTGYDLFWRQADSFSNVAIISSNIGVPTHERGELINPSGILPVASASPSLIVNTNLHSVEGIDRLPVTVTANPPRIRRVVLNTPRTLVLRGDAVDLDVEFTRPVILLDSAPHRVRLLLNTGEYAIYESGNGTSTIRLRYTVKSAVSVPILGIAGAAALEISAFGIISDATMKSVAANLTIPEPFELKKRGGIIGGDSPSVPVEVDTGATSHIISISTYGNILQYSSGDVLDLAVQFDRSVTITGTATLELITPSASLIAQYMNVSSSQKLFTAPALGAEANRGAAGGTFQIQYGEERSVCVPYDDVDAITSAIMSLTSLRDSLPVVITRERLIGGYSYEIQFEGIAPTLISVDSLLCPLRASSKMEIGTDMLDKLIFRYIVGTSDVSGPISITSGNSITLGATSGVVVVVTDWVAAGVSADLTVTSDVATNFDTLGVMITNDPPLVVRVESDAVAGTIAVGGETISISVVFDTPFVLLRADGTEVTAADITTALASLAVGGERSTDLDIWLPIAVENFLQPTLNDPSDPSIRWIGLTGLSNTILKFDYFVAAGDVTPLLDIANPSALRVGDYLRLLRRSRFPYILVTLDLSTLITNDLVTLGVEISATRAPVVRTAYVPTPTRAFLGARLPVFVQMTSAVLIDSVDSTDPTIAPVSPITLPLLTPIGPSLSYVGPRGVYVETLEFELYVEIESLAGAATFQFQMENAHVTDLFGNLVGPEPLPSIITIQDLEIASAVPIIKRVDCACEDGVYHSGELLDLFVVFDKPVVFTSAVVPQLELFLPQFPANTRLATYTYGNGTNELHFNFVVPDPLPYIHDLYPIKLNYAGVLAFIDFLRGSIISGIPYDVSHEAETYLPHWADAYIFHQRSVILDFSYPTIRRVYAPDAPLGKPLLLSAGNNVLIGVEFSSAVAYRLPLPQLILEVGTGEKIRTASIVGGNNTNTLWFNFIAEPGDLATHLDYVDTRLPPFSARSISASSSLALASRESATSGVFTGILANIFLSSNYTSVPVPSLLPLPGTEGSLSSTSEIRIDTLRPRILLVNTTLPSGTYGGSRQLEIVTYWSVPVIVGGCPRMMFIFNNEKRYAVYHSGSGTSQLVFHLNVRSSDYQLEIDYFDTGSLSLDACAGKPFDLRNQYIIRDSPSNALFANLTLPWVRYVESIVAPLSITGSGNLVNIAGASFTPTSIALVNEISAGSVFGLGDLVRFSVNFNGPVVVEAFDFILEMMDLVPTQALGPEASAAGVDVLETMKLFGVIGDNSGVPFKSASFLRANSEKELIFELLIGPFEAAELLTYTGYSAMHSPSSSCGLKEVRNGRCAAHSLPSLLSTGLYKDKITPQMIRIESELSVTVTGIHFRYTNAQEPNSGRFITGDAVELILTFSHAVSIVGQPSIRLDGAVSATSMTGTAPLWLSYSHLEGDNLVAVFKAIIASDSQSGELLCGIYCRLTVSDISSITRLSDFISFVPISLRLPRTSACTESHCELVSSSLISSKPSVVRVHSDSSALLSLGDVVSLLVEFTAPVRVVCGATLVLDLPGYPIAQFVDLADPYTLHLQYAITGDDNTGALDYLSRQALQIDNPSDGRCGVFAASTYIDIAADLLLPARGSDNSLGRQSGIVINQNRPDLVTLTFSPTEVSCGDEVFFRLGYTQEMKFVAPSDGSPVAPISAISLALVIEADDQSIMTTHASFTEIDNSDIVFSLFIESTIPSGVMRLASTNAFTLAGYSLVAVASEISAITTIPQSLYSSVAITIDRQVASVISVSSTDSSSQYALGVGDRLAIIIRMSAPVIIPNPSTILLALRFDLIVRYARFDSISDDGLEINMFYVIQEEDNTDALEVVDRASFVGEVFQRSSCDVAIGVDLTLPVLGSANSLTGCCKIVVNSDPPYIFGVFPVKSPGILGANEKLLVIVRFSRPIYVAGRPSLLLRTGPNGRTGEATMVEVIDDPDVSLVLSSRDLLFEYYIQPGDSISSLTYASSDALVLPPDTQILQLSNNPIYPADISLRDPDDLTLQNGRLSRQWIYRYVDRVDVILRDVLHNAPQTLTATIGVEGVQATLFSENLRGRQFQDPNQPFQGAMPTTSYIGSEGRGVDLLFSESEIPNIAATGKATQSTTVIKADRAIDGIYLANPGSSSISETSEENSPYWRLDFSNPTTIRTIRIFERLPESWSPPVVRFTLKGITRIPYGMFRLHFTGLGPYGTSSALSDYIPIRATGPVVQEILQRMPLVGSVSVFQRGLPRCHATDPTCSYNTFEYGFGDVYDITFSSLTVSEPQISLVNLILGTHEVDNSDPIIPVDPDNLAYAVVHQFLLVSPGQFITLKKPYASETYDNSSTNEFLTPYWVFLFSTHNETLLTSHDVNVTLAGASWSRRFTTIDQVQTIVLPSAYSTISIKIQREGFGALSLAEVEVFPDAINTLSNYARGSEVQSYEVGASYNPLAPFGPIFGTIPAAGRWIVQIEQTETGTVVDTYARGSISDAVLVLTDYAGVVHAFYPDMRAEITSLPRYGRLFSSEAKSEYNYATWEEEFSLKIGNQVAPDVAHSGLMGQCIGDVTHGGCSWVQNHLLSFPPEILKRTLGDVPLSNTHRRERVVWYLPHPYFSGQDYFTYTLFHGANQEALTTTAGRVSTQRSVHLFVRPPRQVVDETNRYLSSISSLCACASDQTRVIADAAACSIARADICADTTLALHFRDMCFACSSAETSACRLRTIRAATFLTLRGMCYTYSEKSLNVYADGSSVAADYVDSLDGGVNVQDVPRHVVAVGGTLDPLMKSPMTATRTKSQAATFRRMRNF